MSGYTKEEVAEWKSKCEELIEQKNQSIDRIEKEIQFYKGKIDVLDALIQRLNVPDGSN